MTTEQLSPVDNANLEPISSNGRSFSLLGEGGPWSKIREEIKPSYVSMDARFIMAHAGLYLLPKRLFRQSRALLYALAGANVDWRRVRIAGMMELDGDIRNLTILGRPGVTTFINWGVSINSAAPVTIGAGAHLAPGVKLETASHQARGKDQPVGPTVSAPIEIGDDVLIYSGTTVVGGVTIGPNVDILGGAFVNKSIPANAVVAGVPARIIHYKS